MVPEPDMYNGKPHALCQWIFGLELYFAAYRLEHKGEDSTYCCSLAASLLIRNTLQCYCLACSRNPAAIFQKFEDLVSALRIQLGVVEEARNARDRFRTLVQRGSVFAVSGGVLSDCNANR